MGSVKKGMDEGMECGNRVKGEKQPGKGYVERQDGDRR